MEQLLAIALVVGVVVAAALFFMGGGKKKFLDKSRQKLKLGKITIQPVETKLQLADAMTKALPRPQHEFLMEKYCGSTADF